MRWLLVGLGVFCTSAAIGQQVAMVQPAAGMVVQQYQGQIPLAVKVTGAAAGDRCFVTVHIRRPDGSLDHRSLFDDGEPSHYDEAAGDEVFSNRFADLRDVGRYVIGPVWVDTPSGKKPHRLYATVEVRPGSPVELEVTPQRSPPMCASLTVSVRSLYAAGWQEVSLSTASGRGSFDRQTVKLDSGQQESVQLSYTPQDLEAMGDHFHRRGWLRPHGVLTESVLARSSIGEGMESCEFIASVQLSWWQRSWRLLALVLLAAIGAGLALRAVWPKAPTLAGTLTLELQPGQRNVGQLRVELSPLRTRRTSFLFPVVCPDSEAEEPTSVKWTVRSVLSHGRKEIELQAGGHRLRFSRNENDTKRVGDCTVTYSVF